MSDLPLIVQVTGVLSGAIGLILGIRAELRNRRDYLEKLNEKAKGTELNRQLAVLTVWKITDIFYRTNPDLGNLHIQKDHSREREMAESILLSLASDSEIIIRAFPETAQWLQALGSHLRSFGDRLPIPKDDEIHFALTYIHAGNDIGKILKILGANGVCGWERPFGDDLKENSIALDRQLSELEMHACALRQWISNWNEA
ncbi:MAG: hypothetical protein Q7U97_12490 [Rhodocyclaceae bacterium]|nr:hypothetical protein [Rhodocyclaceae bacterium]